jgi:hypothetical protein
VGLADGDALALLDGEALALLDGEAADAAPEPCVTVSWPVIPSWIVQWYAYVPATVNFTCHVSPGPSEPGDVRLPSESKVTLCGTLSGATVHWTTCPVAAVAVAGLNWLEAFAVILAAGVPRPLAAATPTTGPPPPAAISGGPLPHALSEMARPTPAVITIERIRVMPRCPS